MIQLRPYQNEVIQSIKDSGSRRQLVVLPTGTGKTIVFCELARQLDTRTLILAHRDELIQQTVEKIGFVWPDAEVGVVKAERHEAYTQVTVASVQSLHISRLRHMPVNYDLIITDEAHHATAKSYQNIYHRYDLYDELGGRFMNRLHVGVTATPNRTDKQLLGDVYNEVVYERDLLDFIPDYLSDLQIIRRDTGIVLDGVSKTASDLNCYELSDVLNTPAGNQFVVESWKDVASECQSTIVFCADIAHTIGLQEAFIAEGIAASQIDSNMKLAERRQILREFHDGAIQVILNCGILTEGFDCPQVDCILLVRPTRSELLLRQMIGRGTRLYPGKDKCKVIDIACISDDWDLVSPARLFGLKKEVQVESVSEMKESMARQRKVFGDVEFSKAVAGIYDTRSPGKLHWQKIRWKGWLLRCGKDGDLRILPAKTAVGDSKDFDSYDVTFTGFSVADKCKTSSADFLKEDVPLDIAFSYAESFVRERSLDISLALPDRHWHSELASDAQKNYMRFLGAGEHIIPELTKIEANSFIVFYKDLKESEDESNDREQK